MQRFLKSSQSLAKALTPNVLSSGVSLKKCFGSKIILDGNTTAAYVAYAWSESSFIYPISPSSPMGDVMDKWMSDGKKNMFGQTVQCIQMQSEGGAAGSLHGAVASGALTSTFTASQGLLLMIPNMYLLAGELAPTVFHVAARTISKHALSIFNDHSDVMACRQTGWAQLCAANPQMVHDFALVSHQAALKSSIPFLHFFDGFQTSHQIANLDVLSYREMKKLFPEEAYYKNLVAKKQSALNPMIRGAGQRPDIFFQVNMANKKFYDALPEIVLDSMNDVSKLTGRKYKLFDYHGAKNPEHIIVIMGSGAQTCFDVVDELNKSKQYNCGVIRVNLFRPFSEKHLLEILPKSVKKVAVLDKTREETSYNPLHLDCLACLKVNRPEIQVVGGTYGLASKPFTPNMIQAVFDNLKQDQPLNQFTVGINDDVTHTSLIIPDNEIKVKDGQKQFLIWGFGGDGSIAASKAAIELINKKTGDNIQCDFIYDSKKEGGVTASHMRFGKQKINDQYPIQNQTDMIQINKPQFIQEYDLLATLKEGGIVLVNSKFSNADDIEKVWNPRALRQIATKKAHLFTIDAAKISQEIGMQKRINTIMQAGFLKLCGIFDENEGINIMKDEIRKMYAKKGDDVIKKNLKGIDLAKDQIKEVKYPIEKWTEMPLKSLVKDRTKQNVPAYVPQYLDQLSYLQGDRLPVSAFALGEGVLLPSDQAKYEKRGVAAKIPIWLKDKCTQCNECSLVCPHGVIRPFLLNKQEKQDSPDGYQTVKAKGDTQLQGYNYSLQVSTMDCTGCAVCADTCPENALEMVEFQRDSPENLNHYIPNWQYSMSLPIRKELANPTTVKGSQFLMPYLEFHLACAGCGETAYVKLVTQLFGNRMVIANASGCSSVWGGTAYFSPYVKDKENRGPAWGRSLFEDNAEYGFGMFMANKQKRLKLAQDMQTTINTIPALNKDIIKAFKTWMSNMSNVEECERSYKSIPNLLEQIKDSDVFINSEELQNIYKNPDLLIKQSYWLIGGDGWAYDIDFGGLDHVLSKNEDVNILVLDTEMYSNTGGQISKATSKSTAIKFAVGGKKEIKKDLGTHAMSYNTAYVASVAMGANFNQTLQAIREAENFSGTSLILALSPCVDWGYSDVKELSKIQQDAVESGYWSLYRFNPSKLENSFILDSKKIRGDIMSYLKRQNRFVRLIREHPEMAKLLHKQFGVEVQKKMARLYNMSLDDSEMLEHLKAILGEEIGEKPTLVLYGSETGTAQSLADTFVSELKRRNVKAKAMAMDDYDFEKLQNEKKIYFVVSTCGQGETPHNAKFFAKEINKSGMPSDFLKDVRYAVFGLGDSGYLYFNEAAKRIDERMAQLGAKRIIPLGLGDDKQDEKYETAFWDWLPNLATEMGYIQPSKELQAPVYQINIANGSPDAKYQPFLFPGTQVIPMAQNEKMSPEGYDRDVRHFVFNTKGLKHMTYDAGDCLAVYPKFEKQQVTEFLDQIKLKPAQEINFQNLSHDEIFPKKITAMQLFEEVLDIFGRPNRKFYDMLSMVATDSNQKKELESLLTKEGKPKLMELIKETVTYADLLKLYPSALPKMEYLLQYVPKIKPRLYSIASHPDLIGDQIHLCVIAENWKTPSGKLRKGLCSNYLQRVKPDGENPYVVGKLYPSSITLPDDESVPIVMCALGTGIAPMRALYQKRLAAKRMGQKVGPMTMIFGSRTRKGDFLYGTEMEALQKEEKLFDHIITAFSRDQEKKIYCQHRITEYEQLIVEHLVKNKGYFYICGPSGDVITSVRQAIEEAYIHISGVTNIEAKKYFDDMFISGRYNVEAW